MNRNLWLFCFLFCLVCALIFQINMVTEIPLWQIGNYIFFNINLNNTLICYSNMTSFKRFESKPVVKIILIYDRLNLWCHWQFITIFYQFLHIRIEIIHGSHMYILFLPRVGLYVSFLPLANARGKTSWYKGLPVVKTIFTCHMASMNYFLNKTLPEVL